MSWRATLAFGCLLVAQSTQVAGSEEMSPQREEGSILTKTWRLGDWALVDVRHEGGWGPAMFLLAREGVETYLAKWHESTSFELRGLPPRGDTLADLNGDGVPELWIRSGVSWGHPGSADWILSLADAGIQEVVASPFTVVYLGPADRDGDGVYELEGKDTTFDGWYSAHSGAEGGQDVVLRWEDGLYRLDPGLLPLPWWGAYPGPPSEDWWHQDAAKYLQEGAPWGADGPVPGSLWMRMLDLIHLGRAEGAWTYLAGNWPEWKAGEDTFLGEFLDQLSKSPYCWGLLRINGMAEDETVAEAVVAGDISRRPPGAFGWYNADDGCRAVFADWAGLTEDNGLSDD